MNKGHIRKRGNLYQVLPYAGIDPLTAHELRLAESTTDRREAERTPNRFRAQVDEQRNVATRGVFRMAIEEWLQVHELDDFARESYRIYVRNGRAA